MVVEKLQCLPDIKEQLLKSLPVIITNYKYEISSHQL